MMPGYYTTGNYDSRPSNDNQQRHFAETNPDMMNMSLWNRVGPEVDGGGSNGGGYAGEMNRWGPPMGVGGSSGSGYAGERNSWDPPVEVGGSSGGWYAGDSNRWGPPVEAGGSSGSGYAVESRWSLPNVSTTGGVGTGFGSTTGGGAGFGPTVGGAGTSGGRHSKDQTNPRDVLANMSDKSAKMALDIINAVLANEASGKIKGSGPPQGLRQQEQRGDVQDYSRERRFSPPHQQRYSPHHPTNSHRSTSPFRERQYPSFSPLRKSRYSPRRSSSPLRDSHYKSHRSISPLRESRYGPRRGVSPHDESHYSSYRSRSPFRERHYSSYRSHSPLQKRHSSPNRSISHLHDYHYSSLEHHSNFHRGHPNSPYHEHHFSSYEGRSSPPHAGIQNTGERLSHGTNQYEELDSMDLRETMLDRTQSGPRPHLHNNSSNANTVPPQRANPATMKADSTSYHMDQMSAAPGMMPPIETLFVIRIEILTNIGNHVVKSEKHMRGILERTSKENLRIFVKMAHKPPGKFSLKHKILPLLQDGIWTPEGTDYIVTWKPYGHYPGQGKMNQGIQQRTQNQPGPTIHNKSPADATSSSMTGIPADFILTRIFFMQHGKSINVESGDHMKLLLAEDRQEEVRIIFQRAPKPPGRPFLMSSVLPLLQEGTWIVDGNDYVFKCKPCGQPSGQGTTSDVNKDTQQKLNATPGKMPALENLFVSRVRILGINGTILVQTSEQLQEIKAETPKEKLRVLVKRAAKPPGRLVVKEKFIPLLQDGFWTPSGNDYIITWKEGVQHSDTGQGETAVINKNIQQTPHHQVKQPSLLSSYILKCHMCDVTMSSKQNYFSHLESIKHNGVAESFLNKVNTAITLQQAASMLAMTQMMKFKTGSTRCITCEIPIPCEIEACKLHYNSFEHKLVEKYQNVLCCGIMFTNRIKLENHYLTLKHIRTQWEKQQEETSENKKIIGVAENDDSEMFREVVSELQVQSKTPTSVDSFAAYDPAKPQGVDFLHKKVHYCCKVCPEETITSAEMTRQHFYSVKHFNNVLRHLMKQEKKMEKEDGDMKRKAEKDKQGDGGENPKKRQKEDAGKKKGEEVKKSTLKRSWEDERKKIWMEEEDEDDEDDDEEDLMNEERERAVEMKDILNMETFDESLSEDERQAEKKKEDGKGQKAEKKEEGKQKAGDNPEKNGKAKQEPEDNLEKKGDENEDDKKNKADGNDGESLDIEV